MDKQDIRSRLSDYVNQITRPSKSGFYICPICNSGGHGHINSDGAFSIYKADPTRWKCFSCGRGGDIYDLIGEVESLADFKDQDRRIRETLGLPSAEYQNQPKTEQKKVTQVTQHTQVTQQEPVDFTALYLEANKNIGKTDYNRGLSRETLDRFKIGYIENWKHPKAPEGTESPRLIIPITKHSYLAVDTRDDIPEEQRQYKKSKAKGKDPAIWTFNYKALASADRPIFITEGEIDALSIIDIGGEAVATGSVSYIGQFLERYKEAKTTQPLILALDNDKAGETAEEKLAEALDSIGAKYYRLDIYGDSKDANEALLKDREAFREMIKGAEEQVIKLEEESKEEAREAYYNKTSAEAFLLNSFMDGIDDNIKNPPQPTGFTELDNILDGGLYAGLYIIGAIPSLGKTTFALQIADQIAQSGRDVLIVSLEMGTAELISKSISRLTLLDLIKSGGNRGDAKTAREITKGWNNYSDRDLAIITGAINNYSQIAKKVYILEGIGDITAEKIREAVERHIAYTGNAPVVIVDYLQIVAPHDFRDTEKRATDKTVTELKRLSRDHKTPVIAISSLNRANYNESISFQAMKESGGIEYGSDIVIGLQLKGAGKDLDVNEAKRKYPRQIEAVILKNRNGQTGDTLEFLYYPQYNYFAEAPKKEEERARPIY